MKKVWIIIAAVLTAAGLILFGGAMLASHFGIAKPDQSEYEINTYAPQGDFRDIEIRADMSDITLISADDFRVVCTESDKVRHTVRIVDGTLHITVDDQRSWMDRMILFSKDVSMIIYLPSASYGTLTVDGDTGDVTIPGSLSFDCIDVTTDTGDVTCTASATGKLSLHSHTGDVHLGNAKAAKVDLSVSTGSVRVGLVDCDGTLRIAVSTGKATLTDTVCGRFASTGSTGDLSMENVIASESFAIERDTGDVYFDRCDAGEIKVQTSTGEVEGTLCTEKVFIARSSTGSIDVPDTITGGRCEITTSTGDIHIALSSNA